MDKHYSTDVELPFRPSSKSTLDLIFWPLMLVEDHLAPYCMVCGRTRPLNAHHMVFRSSGNIISETGEVMHKPMITLCGFGNNLRDADGNYYCHGKAHNGLLFFRNNHQVLEFLDLTLPEFRSETLKTFHEISYQDALEMDGWRPVYGCHD